MGNGEEEGEGERATEGNRVGYICLRMTCILQILNICVSLRSGFRHQSFAASGSDSNQLHASDILTSVFPKS